MLRALFSSNLLHKALAGLVVVVAVGNTAGSATSQENEQAAAAQCDQSILSLVQHLAKSDSSFACPKTTDPDGSCRVYWPRAGYCDGYFQKLYSGSVFVAGVHSEMGAIDYQSQDPITITWNKGGFSNVRIRAMSVTSGINYQLDARTDDVGSFAWPKKVLSAEQLSENELGVLITASVDQSSSETMFLPANINAQKTSSSPSGKYEIVVWPELEVESVFFEVFSDANCGRDKVCTPRTDLGRSPYSQWSPIRLPVNLSGKPKGTYRVSIELDICVDNSTPSGSPADCTILLTPSIYHGG